MTTGRSFLFIMLASFLLLGCATIYMPKKTGTTLPALLKGNFVDDYNIQYQLTDSLWTQLPNVKYHIISIDTSAQYLLARNATTNPSEAGLFTRIDYMTFSNMEPFHWGFCLTVYNATTIAEAQTKAKADRLDPKKGCNGYPFSRMKRIE